jgi:OmpA-OmpF porin, OOP family
MKTTNTIKSNLIWISLVAGLSACSHTPAIQEFADTASPTDETKAFESEVKVAWENQVNVLSPHNFDEAQEAVKDAKESLRDKGDSKDTLHHVATGRAYLNRSNEFAELSRSNLQEVVNARQQALSAGAPRQFSDDFQDTDSLLKNVTSDIEKNNLKKALLKRSELQLKYLDLELRAIKKAALAKARETVAKAKKEGAVEYAPQSLAAAEKSIQETEAFITANRHETDEIARRTEETRLSSEQLLKITKASRSGENTSSEELAIRMENEKSKGADKSDQIAQKNSVINALGSENSSLEAEKAFTRLFETARAGFSSTEAEVYKQGNTLTIRLKGLEFPTSQAVLKGSNFPLLAKVQEVIRSFGMSTVIVEGHTDSKGTKIANERLSADRADAVKEYFVANSANETLNIKSIGYGYEKPLATNKTAEGRAQNRRVDVLIQAHSM